MASPLQYGETSQFFELESSCSWIIAAIQWNKYDKLTFNLDHLRGAGQIITFNTEISMKTDNESIQVRRDFRVKWYRSPVDKSVLRELHERSDIKGYLQTLGHLGLLTCTGALTALLFVQEQSIGFFMPFGSMDPLVQCLVPQIMNWVMEQCLKHKASISFS